MGHGAPLPSCRAGRAGALRTGRAVHRARSAPRARGPGIRRDRPPRGARLARRGRGGAGARLHHIDEAANHVAAAADRRSGSVRRGRGRARRVDVRVHDDRPRARMRRRVGAQSLPRSRHRPPDGLADRAAAGGLGAGAAGARARVRARTERVLVRAPRLAGEPPDRTAGARRQPLLRARLHALVEALDVAEHRDRWGRGRRAATRRVRRRRPATSAGRRSRCSQSSSCGRRRTSGRSP